MPGAGFENVQAGIASVEIVIHRLFGFILDHRIEARGFRLASNGTAPTPNLGTATR